MLTREDKIKMLGALGDDKLDLALRALGVGGGDSYFDSMGEEEPEEGLIPWNATDVKVPRSIRPPIVNDADIYEAPEPQGPRPYEQSEALGAELAPWAAGA